MKKTLDMGFSFGHFVILVTDYDTARDFYAKKLGFIVMEDFSVSEDRRWVSMSLPPATSPTILLVKAANDDEKALTGRQAGANVLFYLYTDDITGYFSKLNASGVTVVMLPTTEPWGVIGQFVDLYGNKIEVIEGAVPGT